LKSLSVKFILIIGMVAVAFSAFLLWRTWRLSNTYMRNLTAVQAEMALEFDLAIRAYVGQSVRPISEDLAGKDRFIPEVMSTSYVAREIFGKIRLRFPEFIIKFSSLNPRNPANLASPAEAQIIKYFTDHPEAKRWVGRLKMGGKEFFGHFSPRRMRSSCLRCHGDPQEAPADLIRLYGAKAGFHQHLGEVALDTVAIPLDRMEAALTAESAKQLGITALVLLLLFGAIFLVFQRLVGYRLQKITTHFLQDHNSHNGAAVSPIPVEGKDEISALAEGFNQLAAELNASYALMEDRISERTADLEREVAEHRQAEEELSAARQQFEDIIEFLPDPTFVINSERKVVAWNRAMEEITGLSKEDALGRGNNFYAIPFWGKPKPVLIDLIMESDAELGDKYDYIDRSNNCLVAEAFLPEFAGGNGAYVWLKASALFNRQGKLVGAIESIRDITERKQLENQLRQAQKMEAVGTLAGGIAHDFNNMLQVISGYVQTMQMHPDRTSNQYVLGKVSETVMRASELVQGILTFSRKVETQLQPLDLNRSVAAAVKILKRILARMIKIETILPDGIDLINADSNQLEQILLNLGLNAGDAMPDGGKLIIETRNVTLDEEYCRQHLDAVAGDYVQLIVSDDGQGIDKEHLEHIFEPFYTTKQTGKGTGLGLAMVYGIVKSHSGYVEVHSEPGQGSTFKLYFPVLRDVDAVPADPHTNAPASLRGSETILLVDDEEAIVEVGKSTLEEFGYSVKTVSSGEDAVALYLKCGEEIDLVILDLGMPGMGGGKALLELKKLDPTVKILIASGYSSETQMTQALKDGASGFIAKPYRLDNLLLQIREVLGQGGS
jgi:two-component system cell cycle sensor histidine kinase/response regulator CckA